MTRLGALFAMICLSLLALFGLAHLLDVSVDSVWAEYSSTANRWSALVGVALLIADVFLPVPSSLIMLGLGSIFGPIFGTFFSMVGGMGASLFAFALGRMSKDRVERWLSPQEYQRAQTILSRWGLVAIIMTRPLPILAEATALVAGTSSMGWLRLSIASFWGLLPVCTLFGVTGAGIAELENMGAVMSLTVLAGGLAWLISQRMEDTLK